jgi:hypothetical protein
VRHVSFGSPAPDADDEPSKESTLPDLVRSGHDVEARRWPALPLPAVTGSRPRRAPTAKPSIPDGRSAAEPSHRPETRPIARTPVRAMRATDAGCLFPSRRRASLSQPPPHPGAHGSFGSTAADACVAASRAARGSASARPESSGGPSACRPRSTPACRRASPDVERHDFQLVRAWLPLLSSTAPAGLSFWFAVGPAGTWRAPRRQVTTRMAPGRATRPLAWRLPTRVEPDGASGSTDAVLGRRAVSLIPVAGRSHAPQPSLCRIRCSGEVSGQLPIETIRWAGVQYFARRRLPRRR